MIARPRTEFRDVRLTTVAAVASWLCLVPSVAIAQDTLPLPTALLRRVAEVADGQRLGERAFVLVSRTFPHQVAGVFTTRPDAETVRARLRLPDLVVVGPVRPTIDLGPLGGFIPNGGGCVHSPATTAMDAIKWTQDAGPSGAPQLVRDAGSLGMNPRGICGLKPVPLQDVASLTITTKMRDGTSTSATYPADAIDAVFFTLDVMDKFVFPYYTRLFGAAFSAGMREGIVQQLSGR